LNSLISTYRLRMPSMGRDAGYGFVRLTDKSKRERLRWSAERRARKLGKKLYEPGEVYIGPVPGKGKKVKARSYYVAVAPRSLVTLDPRVNALRSPNMPSEDYVESNLVVYKALSTWKVTVNEFNAFLEQEEFSFRVPTTEEILQAGSIYSTIHNFYLALDDKLLLTVIDGDSFIQKVSEIGDLEVMSHMEVRYLLESWKMSHKEFDALVDHYFPRPPAKVRKKKERIQTTAMERARKEAEAFRAIFLRKKGTLRRNPDYRQLDSSYDFLELAEEVLELNHPYAKELAVNDGIVYAMVRETPWFLNKIAETLEEEFDTAEDAAEELDLL